MHKPAGHIKTRQDIKGIVLAGLLVLALPTIALGFQYHKLNTGTPVKLSIDRAIIDKSGLNTKLTFRTKLNGISTTALTGDNSFVVGDPAYVYMSGGPDDIWYPYTISRQKPEPGCSAGACLVLAGHVKDIKRDSMRLVFNFETFVVPQNLNIRDQSIVDDNSEIVVMVDNIGRSTLRSLRLGDQVIDQRNLFKFTPPGMRSLGANKAPAKNPPK